MIDYNRAMTTYVAPSDPTGVMGRRFSAYIIDWLLIAGAFVALFATQAEGLDFGDADAASEFCDAFIDENSGACFSSGEVAYVFEDGTGIAFGLPAALGIVNLLILPTITGGSLGKLLTGIRVVRADTFAKAGFGRQLLRLILLFIPDSICFALVGLITSLTSDRHRRVGDMAAGTLVVGKSHVGNPPNTVSFGGATPWASTTPPPSWSPAGAAPPPTAGAWSPPGTQATPGAWSPPGAAPPPPTPGAWSPPGTPSTPAPDAWAPPSTPAPDAWAVPGAAPAPWAPPDPGSAAPQPSPPPAAEPPPAAPDAPPPDAPPPGVNTPVWDDARNTYIQWDPELSAWMEWNDVSKSWVPISQ